MKRRQQILAKRFSGVFLYTSVCVYAHFIYVRISENTTHNTYFSKKSIILWIINAHRKKEKNIQMFCTTVFFHLSELLSYNYSQKQIGLLVIYRKKHITIKFT